MVPLFAGVGDGVTDDGLHVTVLNALAHPGFDSGHVSTVVAPKPHVMTAVQGRLTLLDPGLAGATVPDPYPSSLQATDAVVSSAGLYKAHAPPT